jgi:hypothetical protein
LPEDIFCCFALWFESNMEMKRQTTILFDIDDTLCQLIALKATPTKNEAFLAECKKQYDCDVFVHEDEKTWGHLIHDGWITCIQKVLSWEWRVGLFSAGSRIRNVGFRNWLAKKLGVVEDSILCFSREDLKRSKKSICHIGLDLDHTLLIDDDPDNVPLEEAPQCILQDDTTRDYSQWLKQLQRCYNALQVVEQGVVLPLSGKHMKDPPLTVQKLLSECQSRKTPLRSAFLEMTKDKK